MTRILILGATFGTGNMGVGALTAGALAVVSRRFPQATVALLDYGRERKVSVVEVDGRTMSVPLINLRFSWKLFLANNIATLLVLSVMGRLLGSRVRNWTIERNPWLAEIARADMALAVAGGDSFSDIYGLGRFFYVTLPQLLALSVGVPLLMLPQTIGPFRGRFAKAIARLLVEKSSVVYSRDQKGIEECRALLGGRGDAGKVRFCHDMGFVVEPHAPARRDLGGWTEVARSAGRPLIGLNVSGLLMMGGYDRKNMFDLNLDYGTLIDRLITSMIEGKNADVLLIPHVFGEHEESDTRAAEAVHLRLRERFRTSLHLVRGDYDQNEIKHVIGLCDFFVGSRMHACIAALSQCIPAVGIAYSDKFAGVFESIGVGSTVADPRTLTVDQVVALVEAVFESRESERARLCASMPGIKAGVLSLLDGAT